MSDYIPSFYRYVKSITVTNGGTGYFSGTPTIEITGGGGTGATATATTNNGVITGFTITNKGTGYTSVPTVTITGGGGTGAVGTAVLDSAQDNASLETRNRSYLIKEQIPEHIQNDHPVFVTFLEKYYAFMDANYKDPANYTSDIDYTNTQFLDKWRGALVSDFPSLLSVHKSFFYKRAKDFYESKGSRRSIEAWFRILFDENVDVTYPYQYVLKPSDGIYNVEKTIKILNLFMNKKIFSEYIYKKNKIISLSLLFALNVLFLTGCVNKKTYGPSDERPFVLTTFTILADLARNVAGDRLLIESITKPGAEIHSYQFTPSDIVKTKGAKLIIENGLGLEAWFSKFMISTGDIPNVKLTEGMKPLLIEGDAYSGKPNPHAWMSPKRAMNYVDKIVDAFIEIDPDGALEYSSNASTYKAKLESLDKELRDSLSSIPKERRFLVTCEGAFTYLARDYGMKEAYLWPVNAESQVTPRRMVNLIKKIKENEVPTIFCESTVSAEAQMEVAKSSGAVFGGTFYVDSLSDLNGPAPTYIDLLRHNVRLIIKGLSISEVKK